jgi:hypothetical protein
MPPGPELLRDRCHSVEVSTPHPPAFTTGKRTLSADGCGWQVIARENMIGRGCSGRAAGHRSKVHPAIPATSALSLGPWHQQNVKS